MKAKFIGKYHGTGYERNYVFLEYEYKGYKYTVYENLAKGYEYKGYKYTVYENLAKGSEPLA